MEQYLPDICIAGMCLDPGSIEVGSVLIMLGIIFSFSGFWAFLVSKHMDMLYVNSSRIANRITTLIFIMQLFQIGFIAIIAFTGLSTLFILIDCIIIIPIIWMIRHLMLLTIGSSSSYEIKKSMLDGIHSKIFHS